MRTAATPQPEHSLGRVRHRVRVLLVLYSLALGCFFPSLIGTCFRASRHAGALSVLPSPITYDRQPVANTARARRRATLSGSTYGHARRARDELSTNEPGTDAETICRDARIDGSLIDPRRVFPSELLVVLAGFWQKRYSRPRESAVAARLNQRRRLEQGLPRGRARAAQASLKHADLREKRVPESQNRAMDGD